MIRISHGGLRLILKTPAIEDASAIEENANDIDVLDMVPSLRGRFGKAEALNLIKVAMEREPVGEFHFGIYENGSLIGMCAVSGIDNDKKIAEIGYWLGSRHWRQGLGTEALKLLVGFCFAELELETICARVLARNDGSIALLGKLGFARKSVSNEYLNGREESIIVMEIHAKDAHAIKPDVEWHE